VKWYFLPSFGVIFFVSIVNGCIAKWMLKLNKQKMKLKDERMETTNEIFNSIKIIKQNAWEGFFLKKVSHRRHLELRQI